MSEQSQDSKPKNWFARHKVITTILVILVLGIIGSTMDDSQPSPSSNNSISNSSNSEVKPEAVPEPMISVTAIQLFSEYEANEVAADAKYKDKTIEISGTILNIGKDILDTPYVSLVTENLISSVQCMFDKSDTQDLVDLKQNQKVTVSGSISGKLGNLILRQCQLIQ